LFDNWPGSSMDRIEVS